MMKKSARVEGMVSPAVMSVTRSDWESFMISYAQVTLIKL